MPAEGSATVGFIARFVDDHPSPSSAEDLALLDPLLSPDAFGEPERQLQRFDDRPLPLFAGELVRGETPDTATIEKGWSGRRHVEPADGQLGSFFFEDNRHIVMQAKEVRVDRRHAHLFLAGDDRLPGGETLCNTGYMHGVFGSHVCLGNTSFNKLLAVSRDPLNVIRDSGLRVWIRRAGAGTWRQLGAASAMDIDVDQAVWLYLLPDGGRVEVSVDAVHTGPAIRFGVSAVGAELELLATVHLALGDREHEAPGIVCFDEELRSIELQPAEQTLVRQRYPDVTWSIDPDETINEVGGDELLYADGKRRGLPWLVMRGRRGRQWGWTITGQLGEPAEGHDRLGDEPGRPHTLHLPRLRHPGEPGVGRLDDLLPWLDHNAKIHLTAPHGIEQYGGAAWGVRDVCQGPVEWLLARNEHATVRRILLDVFAHQYRQRGDWPQWYMHPPFEQIQSDHCHGDVAVWPLIATTNYLEASGDPGLLDAAAPWTADDGFAITDETATVREHLDHAVAKLREKFVAGTSLLAFGDGDWNDSLQPAQPEMRRLMVSAWTVQLFYQALRRLAEALRRAGDTDAAAEHDGTADAVRRDFAERLVVDGETAGLYLHDADPAAARVLLHPRDGETGVKHRLLPMIRGILSGIFTADEAEHHAGLIRQHLLAPDGARLMNPPPRYSGGLTQHFQRAESAAFFGREIGLMYTHAHLRYAEAMAVLGRGEDLYKALLTVCPIGIEHTVFNALPRQANTYFSSSDAAFPSRSDSAEGYAALMNGDVPVHGGWRVYSSGPGIFSGLIVRRLLGLRRDYDRFVIDPVLPQRLDGLRVKAEVAGKECEILFQVTGESAVAQRLRIDGDEATPLGREAHPYRDGGLSFDFQTLAERLRGSSGKVTIECG